MKKNREDENKPSEATSKSTGASLTVEAVRASLRKAADGSNELNHQLREFILISETNSNLRVR